MIVILYDIVIVGRGVAGSTLAYFIHEQNPRLGIAVLYSSRNKSCSLHSTGIVSAFGMKPGSSLRGNQICTSVQRAENFFARNSPEGVKKVPHFYVHSKKTSWCHLITPDVYLNWLEEKNQCEYWDEYVEEVDGNRVKTASGKIFEGRAIFLASGAYIKKENKFFPFHPSVAESSVVKGSYGIFENIDWGESGFVFSCGKTNLVYRCESKKIIIGGTVDLEEGMEPNREAVKNYYDILSTFFILPSFGLIRLGAGLRHRGRKRMPFWGKMGNNVYGISGLYKNGWSLSFLAAEEVLQQLNLD